MPDQPTPDQESPRAAADKKDPDRRIDRTLGERMPMRILLAEDNLVNQKVALRMLERMGYRADLAEDGRAAISAFERAEYDVVLMDIHMPHMDGLEATQRLRARQGAAEPWIVAMTANAMQGDRERFLGAGMNDYVSKPVQPSVLAAALARAHERRAPAPAPEPEPVAAIEESRLAALREMGDEEFVSEVIALFLRDTKERAATLARSIEEKDEARARREAHTLKAMGANVGATQVEAIARRIEGALSSGDMAAAGALLGALQGALEASRGALARLSARGQEAAA